MPAHQGKFVAYFRVSTDRQGKSGLGLAAQRKSILDYLDGGRWQLIAEFTEVESGKHSDRPELEKALAACKKHKAKLVIAKLDRLSRKSRLKGNERILARVQEIVGRAAERAEVSLERVLRELAAIAFSNITKVVTWGPSVQVREEKDEGGQRVKRLTIRQCSGADQFAQRIATSEEGMPAMFGGLVSPDLVNAFATNRTKPNMNPPTTVPYITEAGT
jgi:hypothetical protein